MNLSEYFRQIAFSLMAMQEPSIDLCPPISEILECSLLT